jgi:hypothetical protein
MISERELSPIAAARRRRGGLLWLWLAGQLALAATMVLLNVSPGTSNVVQLSFPIMTVQREPPPPPPPVAAPAGCPAPVTTIAKVTIQQPADEVTTIVASLTNAGWIAAWNEQHIWVSHDGGATFERELDGPGDVGGVTFDCFGHAIAVRAGAIGIHAEREVWHLVPGMQVAADSPHGTLIGGGPNIAIVFDATSETHQESELAISSDHGASWSFRALDTAYEDGRTTGREHADGSFELAIAYGDCMRDPLAWFEISGDDITEVEASAFSARVLIHDHVAYNGLAVRSRRGGEWVADDWSAIRGVPDDANITWVDGASPRLIANNTIYRIVDGRAKRVGKLPPDLSPMVVDAAGRVWSVRLAKPEAKSGWIDVR